MSFLKLANNPVKFRLFMLSKLPSAFFAGVRLQECTNEKCVASVPFKWFSQNPFRSTYFACLSMAAEMSTGALAMAALYQQPVSMLVIKVESEYFKKAVGITFFTCTDGHIFRSAIEATLRNGEAQTVRARSEGRNSNGDLIAEFFITWSFKARTPKASA